MNYHTDETNQSAARRGKASQLENPTDGQTQSGADHKATGPSGPSGAMRLVNGVFKLLLPLLVIAAAGFFSWQLVATKPEVNKRPAREKAYAVQVITAMGQDHRPNIRLYGTVSASRKVELRALVSGEVIWVNPALSEGQLVREGEDLVRIDPFDYEGGVTEAEANLIEAKAKLVETTATLAADEATLAFLIEQRDFAANDLERAQTLVKSGSLTKQALENRKLTLSQREQAVNAREHNLSVLRARVEQQNANIERLDWRLKQARRNLADTSLKAPFTGLVQTKNVDLGRSVSGNDTLVALYDPDQMDVRFTLSDAQYGRLISDGNEVEGRKISVRWKLGDVVKSHDAVIERVTPEVNAANGGIEVYARVVKGSNLRAGTFVELQVPDKLYQNAISVPQAAVYQGNLLYVVEEGRMQPREVSILAYLGDNVLVDGARFTPKDQIVSTRVAEAGPGLKVLLPSSEPARRGRAEQGGKPDGKGRPQGKQGAERKGKQAEQGAAQ